MHILMIRPYLEGGGATLSLLNLAMGLVKKGHQVSIAAKGGIWLSKAEEMRLPVYRIPLAPSTPLHLFLSIRHLKRILANNDIDLVHSHHRFAGLAARIARQGFNIPIVTTVHEYKDNLDWLTQRSMGDHVITFSQALRDYLIERYRLGNGNTTVLTMGIERIEPLLPHNTRQKRPSIGCISRLSPEKGVGILLEALAEVVNSTSHRPHCYIAGDGPQARELVSMTQKLNINNFVTFMGWQDNIDDILAQVNFLTLPSLQEGFGLVILEGWAQERPTIGSQVGGIPEIINDGQNGLLVPPNDSHALAQAIIHLLENPALVREMGRHGRLETLPRFNIDAMVQETESIYAQVSK